MTNQKRLETLQAFRKIVGDDPCLWYAMSAAVDAYLGSDTRHSVENCQVYKAKNRKAVFTSKLTSLENGSLDDYPAIAEGK